MMGGEACEWCEMSPVDRRKREATAALFKAHGGHMSESKDRDGRLLFFRERGSLRLHGLCDSCDHEDAIAFFRPT